ncbi:MAG: hypothetical protein WCV50_05030 [Patescibacteria group bacterium]|jgi:hypothetical protein
MNESNRGEIGREIEGVRMPRQEFIFTRHAERTPEGDLTSDGLAVAQQKGQALSGAEVYKGYSSLEKSNRAYLTIQKKSEAAGVESLLKVEAINRASPDEDSEVEKISPRYDTRKREGLFFDLTGPLETRIKSFTAIIDAAVKNDHPDYDPKDPKFSKIRAEYQYIGFHQMLADPELVHIFAMGMAAHLLRSTEISNKYVDRRQKALENGEKDAKPIMNDIVIDTGTHSGLIECLLKKTMVRIDPQGGEKRGFEVTKDDSGKVTIDKNFEKIIGTNESIKTGYPVGEQTPERLPVEFENDRFAGEACFIDMKEVRKLAAQFEVYREKLLKWKKDKTIETESEFMGQLEQLLKEY